MVPALHENQVEAAWSGLFPRDVDEFAERERRCWETWGSLNEYGKVEAVRTIHTELERLLGNVEGWLPAAMEDKEGVFEIVIRIYPDQSWKLSDKEKAETEVAKSGIRRAVERLENE